MNSERLRQHAQGPHRSAPHPLCMLYNFQFRVLMGLLSVHLSESLILVPSLGLSFRWFVFSISDVLIFYYIIYYYTLIVF